MSYLRIKPKNFNMRIPKILFIMSGLLISVVMISCKNQQSSGSVNQPDKSNSRNSLDWAGFYHGKLPCADCEGINATMILNDDHTYIYQWRYAGKNDQYYEHRGTFDWDEQGNTIALQIENNTDSLPTVYFVGENFLRQHDLKGKKIEGDLENMYILAKTPRALSVNQWILTTINDQPVPGNKELNKTPMINLNGYNGVLSGNGGCNNIFGSLNLKPHNKISFENIGATKMLCSEMEVETLLIDVLRETNRYSINEDTLLFMNESMDTLARFEKYNSEPPFHTITISSGATPRKQSVVRVPLRKFSNLRSRAVSLHLVSEDELIPVPFQISGSKENTLWFQTPVDMPANTTLTFQLKPQEPKAKTPGMSVTGGPEKHVFSKNGQKILTYNAGTVYPPEGADQAYKRSGFIHPLYAPNGAVLTNIQPVDHMHHYGIWNPWTKTTFRGETVDFWNLKKMEGTVKHIGIETIEQGPVLAEMEAIHHHIAWPESTKQTLAMTERHIIRTFNLEEDMFLIEFEFHITPEESITLEEYRYGGFVFRGNEGWNNETSEFVTSEGLDRDQADGQRARWCIITGETPKGEAGILMMGHTSNFNHPEPLRVWPSDAGGGRGDVFINFSPTRNTSWPLQPEQTYILKYRALVFDGKIDRSTAENYWNDFANALQVSVKEGKKGEGRW